MGNVHMEATQINYRGGSKKMSVEEAIKAAGTEITPEEKEWIDTIPDLASQEIIAPEFDADEGVYAVGDLVIYQGGLYQFTTAHETAGAWNAEEVAAVKVSEQLSSLENGLINVTTLTHEDYIDVYQNGVTVHAYLRSTLTATPSQTHVLARDLPAPKGGNIMTTFAYFDSNNSENTGVLVVTDSGRIEIINSDGTPITNVHYLMGEIVYFVN